MRFVLPFPTLAYLISYTKARNKTTLLWLVLGYKTEWITRFLKEASLVDTRAHLDMEFDRAPSALKGI
jgi:hypothetical protein